MSDNSIGNCPFGDLHEEDEEEEGEEEEEDSSVFIPFEEAVEEATVCSEEDAGASLLCVLEYQELRFNSAALGEWLDTAEDWSIISSCSLAVC